MSKQTGRTKDAGFQVGARKTIEVEPEYAWKFLIQGEGLKSWLGETNLKIAKERAGFKSANGSKGKITTFKECSHLRLKWNSTETEDETILQLRVIPKEGKTTIAFHQEKLKDSGEREKMKQHWKKILDKLKAILESQ